MTNHAEEYDNFEPKAVYRPLMEQFDIELASHPACIVEHAREIHPDFDEWDAFDLKPGDTVHFTVREGGEIVMEPDDRDIRELRGCVETDVEGVSVEEMKDIVRQRGSES